MAAVAPDAKLNTPAIGLATVPTTPLPKPAINPYDIDILSNNKVTWGGSLQVHHLWHLVLVG